MWRPVWTHLPKAGKPELAVYKKKYYSYGAGVRLSSLIKIIHTAKCSGKTQVKRSNNYSGLQYVIVSVAEMAHSKEILCVAVTGRKLHCKWAN